MPDASFPVLSTPYPQAIHRARARMALETLTLAIHQLVVAHNASGGTLLEVHEKAECVEVFQRGLIFPSLRVTFDAAMFEVSFHAPARGLNQAPVQGIIAPAYNGNLLMIDAAGIAHRMPCRELARFLLEPALSTPSALRRAA